MPRVLLALYDTSSILYSEYKYLYYNIYKIYWKSRKDQIIKIPIINILELKGRICFFFTENTGKNKNNEIIASNIKHILKCSLESSKKVHR